MQLPHPLKHQMPQPPTPTFFDRVLLPAYEMVISPVMKNLPLMLLTWSLVAVIFLVAKDPICRNLPMGSVETFVNLAFGFIGKYVILTLMIFYLIVGFIFALRKQDHRVEELQEKFFRPVVVPVLFQMAGLLGAGISASNATYAGLRAAAIAGAVVLLALAAHNIASLLRKAPNAA